MFDIAKPQFSLGLVLLVATICSLAFALGAANVYPTRSMTRLAVASVFVALPFFIFTGVSGRETFLAILLFASLLASNLLGIAMNHVEDSDILQALLVGLLGAGWFSLALPPVIVLSCLTRYFYSRKNALNDPLS